MKTTVESKLKALLELQAIDSELDNITNMRGALPEEVDALRDELTDLKAHLQTTKESLKETDESIALQRKKAKEAEGLVKKYEDQQMEVRNNREYDAITKEIDLQKLEMQLAEKRIKTIYEQIEKQKLDIEQQESIVAKKQQILEDKQEELQTLITESEDEERKLHEQRNQIARDIEGSLVNTYERIRSSVRNKRAVVVIQREACGGCFNIVPPQRQADIQEKKRIITCEYCGRIIADVAMPPAEEAN